MVIEIIPHFLEIGFGAKWDFYITPFLIFLSPVMDNDCCWVSLEIQKYYQCLWIFLCESVYKKTIAAPWGWWGELLYTEVSGKRWESGLSLIYYSDRAASRHINMQLQTASLWQLRHWPSIDHCPVVHTYCAVPAHL